MDLINLAIQAGMLLVALLAVLIPVMENNKKKQIAMISEIKRGLKDELDEIKEQHKDEVLELKDALGDERKDRVEKTARLHARIDEMQKDLIGDLRGELSDIKGQLKGVTNIMTQIQGWFIDQAGQNQGKCR